MAKNKTEIHVTTVFDGELDATDVFVSLISQKYGKTNTKEYLAKKKDLKYNEDEVQQSQIPPDTVWIVWVNGYDERNGIQNNRFSTCRGLSCGGLLQAVKGR